MEESELKGQRRSACADEALAAELEKVRQMTVEERIKAVVRGLRSISPENFAHNMTLASLSTDSTTSTADRSMLWRANG